MDTAEKIILLCFLLQGVCCRDFNISLPEKIQALGGSCVIIKCRFEINDTYDTDLTDTATGAWFKDGTDVKNNLVFNSSTSDQSSGIKGKITGKLKDKDCTTVFTDISSTDTGRYYFRIEGEGGLKYTYKESSVSVNVIDASEISKCACGVEANNSHGNSHTSVGFGVSFFSVLIGVAVLSLAVVILCGITCICIRNLQATQKEVVQRSDQDADKATQEEATMRNDEDADGTVQNDGAIESDQTSYEGDKKSGQNSYEAIPQENKGESDYVMMSSVAVKANEECQEDMSEDMSDLYATVNRFNP